MNLTHYIQRQKVWSTKTFGPGKRTIGLVKHIQKELKEIQKEPTSVEEWVDVIILAVDGAWRAGHAARKITSTLSAKQRKNFKRTYPFPKSENHASEHVRTPAELAKRKKQKLN